MSLGRDQLWKRDLIRLLPDARKPCCVDLASGTGDVAFELAGRYHDAEIVGIDLTPAMIAIAEQRNSWPERVRFQVADMCETGLPDAFADMVTGSYALRNAPVLGEALREIFRLLKPGGYAVFLDFSKSPSPWRQRLQLSLLRFWGGLCGLFFHGRPEHVYIADSLSQFPDSATLKTILEKAGFELVEARPCFGGMLSILLLRKR